jgi:glycosyltransferase involved in cell wall biosynthesis
VIVSKPFLQPGVKRILKVEPRLQAEDAMLPFKIACIVHGRFHAFDLTRELTKLGHDVTLFTNYPPSVAARFGIPKQKVRSFLAHGILSRAGWRVLPRALHHRFEQASNTAFSRWAARSVLGANWDVVIAFSGVAEDTFRGLENRPELRMLVRGSAHIAVQRRILDEEKARAGVAIDAPSDWIVAREKREYELADVIQILSDFAKRSFIEEGVEESRLFLVRLGVEVSRFHPSPRVIEQRCKRILSGDPIRVLNVGTFSLQKGALDWSQLIKSLPESAFRFRFVGPIASDAKGIAARLPRRIEFRGKLPQDLLPKEYEWGDLFVLPTLQDGFAVVLTQALAAGLPLVTSPNCAGPDLIKSGINGWVVPIRSPELLRERLLWLDQNRHELCQAVTSTYECPRHCDWSETAKQVQYNILEGLRKRKCLVLRESNGF